VTRRRNCGAICLHWVARGAPVRRRLRFQSSCPLDHREVFVGGAEDLGQAAAPLFGARSVRFGASTLATMAISARSPELSAATLRRNLSRPPCLRKLHLNMVITIAASQYERHSQYTPNPDGWR
jgi:hypothetical protein